MKVKNCGKFVDVHSIDEASKVIRKTIVENGMGSTKWYTYKKNGVVCIGNKEIGRISYNGRVWV